MAITVPDNMSYGGKKPNFDRDQFETLEAMMSYPKDFLDEGHISYCVETKAHYKWTGSEWVKQTTEIADGSITESKLSKDVQNKLNKVGGLVDLEFYEVVPAGSNMQYYTISPSPATGLSGGSVVYLESEKKFAYRLGSVGRYTAYTDWTSVDSKTSDYAYSDNTTKVFTDNSGNKYQWNDKGDALVEYSSPSFSGSAADVTYDNSKSNISSTNVQEAIDYLVIQINSLTSRVTELEEIIQGGGVVDNLITDLGGAVIPDDYTVVDLGGAVISEDYTITDLGGAYINN